MDTGYYWKSQGIGIHEVFNPLAPFHFTSTHSESFASIFVCMGVFVGIDIHETL